MATCYDYWGGGLSSGVGNVPFRRQIGSFHRAGAHGVWLLPAPWTCLRLSAGSRRFRRQARLRVRPPRPQTRRLPRRRSLPASAVRRPAVRIHAGRIGRRRRTDHGPKLSGADLHSTAPSRRRQTRCRRFDVAATRRADSAAPSQPSAPALIPLLPRPSCRFRAARLSPAGF